MKEQVKKNKDSCWKNDKTGRDHEERIYNLSIGVKGNKVDVKAHQNDIDSIKSKLANLLARGPATNLKSDNILSGHDDVGHGDIQGSINDIMDRL